MPERDNHAPGVHEAQEVVHLTLVADDQTFYTLSLVMARHSIPIYETASRTYALFFDSVECANLYKARLRKEGQW